MGRDRPLPQPGDIVSKWHYSSLTGSVTQEINYPVPGVQACHISLAEMPGFESTAGDIAEITPYPGGLLVDASVPFFQSGILTVTSGAQAGFCSAIGPFGNEFVGSRTVAEFNKQAAPTFVANLNRLPDTMSFNFPYSSNDVSVTLTSTIRVSRA